MKKILLFFLFIISISAKGQIPNGDFENWCLSIFGSIDPCKWITTNREFGNNVYPDSGLNADHGKYSILLFNDHTYGRPAAAMAFPLLQHPSYFTASIKLNLADSDTALIGILLLNNSIVVDSGFWIGTSHINNFMQIQIPLTQSSSIVDSAIIGIEINNAKLNTPGTKFWVDHLLFDSTTNVHEIKNEAVIIDVSPNPFHTTATLTTNFHLPFSNSQLKIFDVMGRMVKEQIINGQSAIINRENLADGIYFYQLTNYGWQVASGRFVVD